MKDHNENPSPDDNNGVGHSSLPPTRDGNPPASAYVPSPISVELSPEQWSTAEELSRLDSHLAGLYRLGLELLPRAQEPGAGYLIAHAGRELSRGVFNLLGGSGVTFSSDTSAEIPDNQKNRVTIGNVLQLPPTHPLVTKWFRLHSTFVRYVHFRQPTPDPEDVRKAFLGLSELLFGRIGPYFATHAQLDELLSIESPDEAAVERARPMLSRPVQRQYFFNTLAHPGWLVPLETAGQFSNPPDMVEVEEGKWQLQPWPEGEYLIKMAKLEPEKVKDILLRLPKTIRNPAVWTAVARAATELPGRLADRLTDHIENSLKSPVVAWFTLRVIALVRKLAEEKQKGALRLAYGLLQLNEELDSSSAQVRLSTGLRPLRESEWVLARLDSFTLGQFIKEVVPALAEFKPYGAITLLSRKLEGAARLIEQASETPTYLARSTTWCPRIDTSPDHDVRAKLAVALAGVATRVAAAGEEEAAKVIKLLSKYEHEIFQRIIVAVLTVAGQFVKQQLDEKIADPRLIDSPPAPREYASFLRAQFGNASIRAQRLFVYALERGPDPKTVQAVLRYEEAEPTEERIQEVVAEWQRRRLLWFQDQIPELLLPLAGRLGAESKALSERERALNEEGFYSSSETWVGDPSPISDEQVATMSADDLVEYLETRRPETTPSGQRPTTRGLEQAVARYVAANPEAAGDLAEKLITSSASPGYPNAVLSGFKDAFDQGRAIPWSKALALASFVVDRAGEDRQDAEEMYFTWRWEWAVSEAVRLIEKGCAGNHIPAEEADTLWRILGAAVASPATWSRDNLAEDFTSFSSILDASLNVLPGHVVEALINVALWEYRIARLDEKKEVIKDSSAVTPRLVPLLEGILEREGRSGLAAQAMLGQFIPQVHLMARAWTLQSTGCLFEGGATSPLTKPVWAAYITRSHLYDNVFRDLRPWYVAAVDAAREENEEAAPRDRTWAPSRHLAVMVLAAVMRGLASVGDADELVERTFLNVKVEDRTHTYWNTFRSWSDSEGEVAPGFIERLVRFWEWRLQQLESSNDSDQRTEEAIGLRWFLATPHVPAIDALRLGRRTIELSGVDVEDRGAQLWERLVELSEQDAGGTYEIAERLIQEELTRDFPYLPYESIAPSLARALKHGDDHIKKRTERLINTLGERGLYEYGMLLGGGSTAE